MWLPDKLYERVPQFWLLIGLVFMSSAVYLGFDYSLTKFYFATGLICCVFSLCIFTVRLRNRKAPMEARKYSPAESKNPDEAAESRAADA